LWSSPELARDLISISATEEKTLLDRVKEILSKIFNNLFKGNLTLFEEASDLVLNLLDENVSTNGKGIFYEQTKKNDLDYYTKQLLQLREDFTKVVKKRKDFKTSHVYEVLVDGEWRDADMSVT